MCKKKKGQTPRAPDTHRHETRSGLARARVGFAHYFVARGLRLLCHISWRFMYVVVALYDAWDCLYHVLFEIWDAECVGRQVELINYGELINHIELINQQFLCSTALAFLTFTTNWRHGSRCSRPLAVLYSPQGPLATSYFSFPFFCKYNTLSFQDIFSSLTVFKEAN